MSYSSQRDSHTELMIVSEVATALSENREMMGDIIMIAYKDNYDYNDDDSCIDDDYDSITWMTSRVLMVSMGIITVTLAAAATAPSTNDTWKMKRQTRE